MNLAARVQQLLYGRSPYETDSWGNQWCAHCKEPPGKPHDPECAYASLKRDLAAGAAVTRAEELEGAIRRHRDAKGHARCWEDDAALYAHLPEGNTGDQTLPPREEFLKGCERYYELRRQGRGDKCGACAGTGCAACAGTGHGT